MNESDPIGAFARWFDEVSRAGIDKPNAMTLSTVGADGRPASRVVLLSSFDERGFVFHGNYESRKGGDIARAPPGYQVRIEGRAEKTRPEESDAYFARRPRGSQLGAWASDQSRAIES